MNPTEKFERGETVIYCDGNGNKSVAQVTHVYTLIGNFVQLSAPYREKFDPVTGAAINPPFKAFILHASAEEIKALKEHNKAVEEQKRVEAQSRLQADERKFARELAEAEEWAESLTEREQRFVSILATNMCRNAIG